MRKQELVMGSGLSLQPTGFGELWSILEASSRELLGRQFPSGDYISILNTLECLEVGEIAFLCISLDDVEGNATVAITTGSSLLQGMSYLVLVECTGPRQCRAYRLVWESTACGRLTQVSL